MQRPQLALQQGWPGAHVAIPHFSPDVPAVPVVPAAPIVPAAPVVPAAPIVPAAPVVPAPPDVPAAPVVPPFPFPPAPVAASCELWTLPHPITRPPKQLKRIASRTGGRRVFMGRATRV